MRRALAHRAHSLKAALVDKAAALRGAHEADRREYREVGDGGCKSAPGFACVHSVHETPGAGRASLKGPRVACLIFNLCMGVL